MRPIKRRHRPLDQGFEGSERLFRRVPPDCIGPNDEIDVNNIKCSFGKDVESAPSVIREKYSTVRDTLNRLCAGSKNVSSEVVFFLTVQALPKSILSGTNEPHDFYPFHAPLKHCYAHTVIACKRADSPAGTYKEPTRPVKNAFRARFALELKRAEVPTFFQSLCGSWKKRWSVWFLPSR